MHDLLALPAAAQIVSFTFSRGERSGVLTGKCDVPRTFSFDILWFLPYALFFIFFRRFQLDPPPVVEYLRYQRISI